MTLAIDRYQAWLADPLIDSATKRELEGISQQANEIEDRFYRDLEFGTGGLRGVMGAGTNRLNVYTVGKATQGFARFLVEQAAGVSEVRGRESGRADGAESDRSDKSARGAASVVIAYDSRNQSPEFALEAALVLAANGVKAYVFESLRATPELS